MSKKRKFQKKTEKRKEGERRKRINGDSGEVVEEVRYRMTSQACYQVSHHKDAGNILPESGKTSRPTHNVFSL